MNYIKVMAASSCMILSMYIGYIAGIGHQSLINLPDSIPSKVNHEGTYPVKDELIQDNQEATVVDLDADALTIAKFIQASNPGITQEEADTYTNLICKYADRYHVDRYMAVGLIEVESTFNRYAISKVGALGLTQVMLEYHKDKVAALIDEFGHFDAFDPEHNIALGLWILADYKKTRNYEQALLKYNGSLQTKATYTYADRVIAARERAISQPDI